MRLITAAVFLLWTAVGVAWAQSSDSSPGTTATSSPGQVSSQSASSASLSIEESFKATDLAGKLKIIQQVAANPTPRDGPLCQEAIDYLVSNLSLLRTTKEGEALAADATKLVGVIKYEPAARSVWQLFQFSTTLHVRVLALDTLSLIGNGNGDVINKLNHWLVGRNLLHQTGSEVSPQLVDACVRTLGKLRDPSSFQVIFATMEAGYAEPVKSDARKALGDLKGDLAKQLLEVVTTARFSARPAAMEMAMTASRLRVSEKGEIATAALRSALEAAKNGQASLEDVSAIRFRAARALGVLQWTPAAELLLGNFNRAAIEYTSKSVSPENLVISANALADMATHEAAVRLSLYLGLINSLMRKGQAFDESVTLAIVGDLGRLGDVVAYENLFSMQFLDYPDSIKAAAQEAIRSLTNR